MAAEGDGSERAPDSAFVDVLRIVGTAVPVAQATMVLVSRIGHSVKEELKPGRAADILWRAAPFAVDEARVFDVRLAGADPLDGYGMSPVVTHVVGIAEFAYPPVDKGSELHVLGRCYPAAGPSRVLHAVALPACLDMLEMIILPAHCDLDDIVEQIQTDRDRYIDAAPNRRFNVVQHDMQAGNGFGAHAAKLAGSSLHFYGPGSSDR